MDESLIAPGSIPEQSSSAQIPQPGSPQPAPDEPAPAFRRRFQDGKAFIIIPLVLIIIVIVVGAFLILTR